MKRLMMVVVALMMAAGVVAQTTSRTKVVAHRGYWTVDGSAQNSLTSFAKADEVGCFGSEIDVWYTKDHKLVVNHDRVFQGVHMERATAKELTALKLANGENLPSLDAYLRLVQSKPNTRLIYEAKSLSDFSSEDDAAALAVKMLRKYGLLERTDFICFSINYCLAFKKLLPEANIYYLNGDLPPKSIKKLGFTGIDYSAKVLRVHPEWVKEAHDLGLEVNVWTANTEEDIRYFVGLGVDYITTDYPELAQKIAAE